MNRHCAVFPSSPVLQLNARLVVGLGWRILFGQRRSLLNLVEKIFCPQGRSLMIKWLWLKLSALWKSSLSSSLTRLCDTACRYTRSRVITGKINLETLIQRGSINIFNRHLWLA